MYKFSQNSTYVNKLNRYFTSFSSLVLNLFKPMFSWKFRSLQSTATTAEERIDLQPFEGTYGRDDHSFKIEPGYLQITDIEYDDGIQQLLSQHQ